MIAIVDYGMGNVRSVINALKLLGAEPTLTAREDDFESASHIILPGVGAFPDGMKGLLERNLIDPLRAQVLEKKKPFLGICLGMQLLATSGEEGGVHGGLGWIDGVCRRLKVDESQYRLPHIGWNDVTLEESPLGPARQNDFYFVHSYVLDTDFSQVIGQCDYGETFAAVVHKENIFGVQFHPEKSQDSGLELLKRFIAI